MIIIIASLLVVMSVVRRSLSTTISHGTSMVPLLVKYKTFLSMVGDHHGGSSGEIILRLIPEEKVVLLKLSNADKRNAISGRFISCIMTCLFSLCPLSK